MALFGTQIVISMIMACVLQKLSFSFSFARWLLGKKLFAYLPPSIQELQDAEGIKEESKKHKKKGSSPDYKISKNVNVALEHIPVTADDLSALQFYPEYQWLLDFMAYTTLLYGITEVYLFMRPNLDEVNMSVLWCLLVVIFVVRTLLSLAKIYFRSEETSAERSMCLVCGLTYLLIAMLILIVDEKWLEFGLRDAYDSFKTSVTKFSEEISLETAGPTSELIFKLSLAAWAGVVGALLVFPGIRFAQMHRDLLASDVIGPPGKMLVHLNFVFPLFVLMMWVTPVAREYFTQRIFSGMSGPVMTPDQFEISRIMTIIIACVLRLWLFNRYMQAYMNVAQKKIRNLQKEAGRIQISEFRKTISSVFNYSCVVALQYVAPAVLLLFSVLLLKTLGDYSWAGLPGETILPKSSVPLPFSLHRLKEVFTPALFRGVFNFATWWISASIFFNSIIGYAFYSYNEKA
ncbi:transmembrane protein 161B-like [Varroa jacobsoni]|uniref:transmembrane protein 161B-like n=1 Tax=Varroa jacobsoni TaxID=62625 RepID=UPI000BF9114B|nr:transmembrane protein 161B-like [Varroa jacobsoni]